MGTYSSGEELVVKTRKPYTITKQRERWTEDEHNRFLEALKLYGRAWQRIEEHIGTKTAVQIRSHAQKFFTKLEKEALVKGVPVGQALDIDIPPPRPKRKPSNPYPRKTSVGAPTSQVGARDGKLSPLVSSLCPGKQILDLEKEPLSEKLGGDEKSGNSEKNHDKDGCSEVLDLFQEPHCTSLSSANKNAMPPSVASGSTCTFREFMPMIKGAINQDETNESHVSTESKGNQSEHFTKQTGHEKCNSNISCSRSTKPSDEELVRGEKADEQQQPNIFSAMQSNDMQGTQHYPRHVPVHVLDGSLGMSTQHVSPDMSCQESTFHQMGVHGQANLFTNPAASATTEHHSNATRSSFHQSFPAFHPLFTAIHNNQNDFESSLHMSPNFSNLIVSTLLQNPAAHAAASFAAAFWPCTNMEASLDSLAGATGGFPSRQMNPAPSMAAIAAATVAAATAWWAAHGLLPLCAPLYTGFACTPASATAAPTDTNQVPAANCERKAQNPPLPDQPLDLEISEPLREQHSASKSPTLSSSDSGENEGAKRNAEITSVDHEKAAAIPKLHDSNKAKGSKQVDRSSCGSNASSSSEVETDVLEKQGKDVEGSKEPDAGQPACDSNNRRTRSSSNMNDSWKEVSEGGRLAFEALFSREVLPQSFSLPHYLKNKGYQKNFGQDNGSTYERVEYEMQVNLYDSKICCSNHQRMENTVLMINENNGKVGQLALGSGYGKFKAHRTGFKPYKRCSVEAKESMMASVGCQGEEKGPKRIRLEGEAST